MTLPKHFFVTGTDTDVGKTYVSVRLIEDLVGRGQSVGVMKPIAAGGQLLDGKLVNGDALALMRASGTKQSYASVNPYLFDEPISPHISAAKLDVEIDIESLFNDFQEIQSLYDRVLVEGAGGWATPLSNSLTMADLAVKLNIPVVLVVGLKLGCLNHAELTQRAIQASGLTLAGWVANALDPEMPYMRENIEYLIQSFDCPLIAQLSHKKI